MKGSTMTYSINVRARTRDDCKQLVLQKMQLEITGKHNHQHDRQHVERLLLELIDLMPETAFDEIVVDAYGYVSTAGDGTLRMVMSNVKVYAAPVGSITIGPVIAPAGMTPPPSGTF